MAFLARRLVSSGVTSAAVRPSAAAVALVTKRGYANPIPELPAMSSNSDSAMLPSFLDNTAGECSPPPIAPTKTPPPRASTLGTQAYVNWWHHRTV